MNILADMNLSPQWCAVLQKHGHACTHWSQVGNPNADDPTIMEWARRNQHVVFTHDLDLGSILACTRARGPSVIQLRTQDVMPSALEPIVTSILDRYEAELAAGALIVVDEAKLRVRILPLLR